MSKLRVKRLKSWARIPTRGTPASSGLDLYATESGTLTAGNRVVVKFGVAVSIPPGFEGQIRGRSSLAKKGILCHLGTIDQDYRGEIMATLHNQSCDDFEIRQFDRVAQLVIAPVSMVECEEVDELDNTYRGSGGFGSTGL